MYCILDYLLALVAVFISGQNEQCHNVVYTLSIESVLYNVRARPEATENKEFLPFLLAAIAHNIINHA
jgi:hypothetical protein